MKQRTDRDGVGEQERALQRLFDATADTAEQHRVDRLARHAAALPERRLGWRGWLRWRWPAVVGVAAVVLVAVVVGWRRGAPQLPVAMSGGDASGAGPQRQPPAGWQPSDDEEALAMLAEEPDGEAFAMGRRERFAGSDNPLAGFALLSVSDDDERLDALEAALDVLLEGGG